MFIPGWSPTSTSLLPGLNYSFLANQPEENGNKKTTADIENRTCLPYYNIKNTQEWEEKIQEGVQFVIKDD